MLVFEEMEPDEDMVILLPEVFAPEHMSTWFKQGVDDYTEGELRCYAVRSVLMTRRLRLRMMYSMYDYRAGVIAAAVVQHAQERGELI